MRMVTVRGIHGGVGASFIASGLAYAFAAVGEKTLAIDAAASPESAFLRFFNFPSVTPGGWLTERAVSPFLSNTWQYVPNLDVLPGGEVRSASGKARFADVMREAERAGYTMLLVDDGYAGDSAGGGGRRQPALPTRRFWLSILKAVRFVI